MGIFRFGRQGGTLGNTEAVLLIGNDQTKGRESNIFCDQCLSADNKVQLACCKLFVNVFFFFGAQ